MSGTFYGFDRRRVNGPEWSVTPTYEALEASTSAEAGPSSSARVDGRGNGDIRPIFLKTGLISQANGSAYIEAAKVKIACAVYGPRQSKSTPYNEKGKLNVEVKYAPFSSKRRRAPMRDTEDRPTSVQVHQALLPSIRLELFPKSTIDIFITVIEADGEPSSVAGATMAASAALADAGIEMLGLVVATSACSIPSDSKLGSAAVPAMGVKSAGGKLRSKVVEPATMDVDSEPTQQPKEPDILIDPTAEEDARADGNVLLACMPALGSITNVRQTGSMSAQVAMQCLNQCFQRCADMHAVLVQALTSAVAEKKQQAEGLQSEATATSGGGDTMKS